MCCFNCNNHCVDSFKLVSHWLMEIDAVHYKQLACNQNDLLGDLVTYMNLVRVFMIPIKLGKYKLIPIGLSRHHKKLDGPTMPLYMAPKALIFSHFKVKWEKSHSHIEKLHVLI